MIRLFRWILGYVEFEFTNGFYEGFINDCFEQSAEIKGITLIENGVKAFCLIPCYKRLHRIALANGGRVHITKKSGLPFYLHPLKDRIGFAVGAFIFVVIISFLGSFIWNVELVGNKHISDAELNEYLSCNGIRVGAMWGATNRNELCWKMMSDFDDIAWVHINKIGTTARVEINETKKAPEPDIDRLQGIKAQRKELEAIAYKKQSKITVTKAKSYYRIRFFVLDLPLYIKKSSGDIEEALVKSVKINGVTLPIGITKYTEKYLNSQEYDLSAHELEALAKKKLALAEKKELDEYIIVNKNVEIEADEDKCIARGAYIVKHKE